MEATNYWFVDVFPFPFGAFSRFHVSLGCIESFKKHFELYVYQTCPVLVCILQQNNLKTWKNMAFLGWWYERDFPSMGTRIIRTCRKGTPDADPEVGDDGMVVELDRYMLIQNVWKGIHCMFIFQTIIFVFGILFLGIMKQEEGSKSLIISWSLDSLPSTFAGQILYRLTWHRPQKYIAESGK